MNPPASDDYTLQIQQVALTERSPNSYRAVLHTSRGLLRCILHPAPPGAVPQVGAAPQGDSARRGVILLGGAIGGFAGPGDRVYARLSDELPALGIACLQLHYRKPNFFEECVLDVLGGVAFLKGLGVERMAVAGHSFGGAIAIMAGVLSPSVVAVVAMASQTYGATRVAEVAPRPLLIVHGKSDTRLHHRNAEQIYAWAQEPKEMVLYEGAEHGLKECDAQLHDLLRSWLPAKLHGP